MQAKPNALACLHVGGFHRVHYVEWGDPDNPRVVICVHGLTRNGRDFDALAAQLAADYRVICPDVAGRGKSDWLADKTAYGYPQYLGDMVALIARAGVAEIDLIGTSMGGLIGMMLAALPQTPIRRLVINDVGPFIPREALQRIASYLGKSERFATLDALEEYLRVIAAPFGPLTEAQWQHLAHFSARELPDGGYAFGYDPGIAVPFNQALDDVDLWSVWDRIQCPTLVLRGAQSDLLRYEDALAMTGRGPRAVLREFAGVGHAPALMAADQIAAVCEWLAGHG